MSNILKLNIEVNMENQNLIYYTESGKEIDINNILLELSQSFQFHIREQMVEQTVTGMQPIQRKSEIGYAMGHVIQDTITLEIIGSKIN